MAKKLSDKVIHCPECGVLKSKSKPCKRCGYGGEQKEEVKSIRLKLANMDMSKYDSVVINGIEFYK
jgi:hypothetical protein